MELMHGSCSSHPSVPRPSCNLPPQLLALVLARLQPAERLGSMARVCSAWRTAAVMATNSISTAGRHCGLCQDGANSLSVWLQGHAAAAALDSLTVKGLSMSGASRYTLRLPVQQLATLRSLDLERLTVMLQGQPGTQAAAIALPPELSAITRLRLWNCPLRLSTLPAFTNLQHLVVGSTDAVPSSSSSSPEVSGLLHLTHLYLCGEYAHDAVLGTVGALTSLQELQVQGASYTAAGFAALPVSLTKLWVGDEPRPAWRNQYMHARTVRPPPVELSLADTPAVAALTALRWLEVDRAAGFSAALLRDMSSLQHLAVRGTPLLAEEEGEQAAPDDADEDAEDTHELGLTVLSGLTQLQHLELTQTPQQLAADPTAADVAALTASSQLTCLIINEGLVRQEQYRYMFPEEPVLRELPQLKELRATMGLLGTAEDAAVMVDSCRNLERLDLGSAMPDEPVFEYFDGWEVHLDTHASCRVAHLCKLWHLTRLTINVQEEDCTDVFWRSMAKLDSLRHLHINELSFAHFGGVVALGKCTALTHLQISQPEENYFTSSYGKHRPYFTMETPEGQPPDIWCKLPHKATQGNSRTGSSRRLQTCRQLWRHYWQPRHRHSWPLRQQWEDNCCHSWHLWQQWEDSCCHSWHL